MGGVVTTGTTSHVIFISNQRPAPRGLIAACFGVQILCDNGAFEAAPAGVAVQNGGLMKPRP